MRGAAPLRWPRKGLPEAVPAYGARGGGGVAVVERLPKYLCTSRSVSWGVLFLGSVGWQGPPHSPADPLPHPHALPWTRPALALAYAGAWPQVWSGGLGCGQRSGLCLLSRRTKQQSGVCLAQPVRLDLPVQDVECLRVVVFFVGGSPRILNAPRVQIAGSRPLHDRPASRRVCCSPKTRHA